MIFMLAIVGPMAVPLFWQSPRFTPGAKRWWTAAVVAVALAGVAFAVWLGPIVERYLATVRDLLESAQGAGY